MKVLFYPDPPVQYPGHTLSKTIRYFMNMKWELTNDIGSNWDVGVYWNYEDINNTPGILKIVNKLVLNIDVNNVTKSYVNMMFKQTFGYSSLADTSSIGYCVRKSERQSAHDGKIIKTPCVKKDGFIYQKLLDNRMAINMTYDIRVPYMMGAIPLIVLKSRSIEGTFENSYAKVKNYEVARTDEVLTIDEQVKIREFCYCYGLDTGELDIIRDNSTGLIYIIDVNNLPGSGLYDHVPDGKALEKELTEYFKKQLEKCMDLK